MLAHSSWSGLARIIEILGSALDDREDLVLNVKHAESSPVCLKVTRAVSRCDRLLTMLYWQIGHRVHSEVLNERCAEYGGRIVSAVGKQSSRRWRSPGRTR